MKEFKLEGLSPVEEVESKIWLIFNILRNTSISSNSYAFILFLLSAYKDGLISTDMLSENKNIKQILVDNIDNDLSIQYFPIFKSYESILSHLSEENLKSIIQALSEIDHEVLSENFSNIFDSVLYRVTQYNGRYGGEFIQPVEITRFMCNLANMEDNAKIYNPFAGLASFGVYFNQGQDYFGQEYNQDTWAIGALRIMAYNRSGTTKYVCDDSILHWPSQSEKFDLIIANPPIGMRNHNHYRDKQLDFRTAEQFLIEKGIQSLNLKGKLIALLPQGFLYSGMSEQRLRQYLIEEDLIDTIISIPGGLLPNTGISLVIMLLNKDKKNSGKVRFIDAKKFVETKSPREKVLNEYELSNLVHGNNDNSEVVRIVSNAQIISFDYNLSVPRYFQKEIDGVKLIDILEFIRGKRSNLPKTGKFIRIKDLKDDKIDFKLDVSYVENSELPRPFTHLIEESCILMALRGRKLKPTYFHFDGEPIFISNEIISVKVNESIADTDYLINELQADYVQEQLEAYRLGNTSIPFIRRDDLLKIVVKLPSIEEQRAKVQGISEISDKIKTLQEERNALAHGKASTQFNEFASLKHTLGRPRQNILDWSDNLLHFLNSKHDGFEAMNKSFADFYENDIISALKEIKRDVNFMTDVLEKGERGFILEEFEKELIPLADINNIINELSSNGFNFKLKKRLIKGEKLKDRGIYGNSTLFKTLIDNLLTNASKHGFEKKEVGNEVVIELTEVDEILNLEVKNNGKPFPKNFDKEKFITKYSSADSNLGTGLGGYDIHRIATDFNNPDWELSLNEDPFYPVNFKFHFPIKLIN